MQKLFISGSAGALLALAVAGRRPKRDVSTWTESRTIEVQTYMEPAAPKLDLPPIIQFLPPPPPRPPRPPQPEIMYELQDPVPKRSTKSQTDPIQSTSSTQSDWTRYPAKVESGAQTAPPVDKYPMGVQTLGIPHTQAFCQAVVATRSSETQYSEDDVLEGLFLSGGGVAGGGYHPLLASGGGGGIGVGVGTSSSSASTSKPLMLDKPNQTEPHDTVSFGVQTGSLFVRDVLTQTRSTESGSGEVRVASGSRRP